MSYEGYEVWYCKNGHKVGILYDFSLSDDPNFHCPVCKVKQDFLLDPVDETNGCHRGCDGTKKTCPNHELDLKIIGYERIECERCHGKGTFGNYKVFVFDNKVGKRKFVSSADYDVCQDCNGTKYKLVPIFDLTPLKKLLARN